MKIKGTKGDDVLVGTNEADIIKGRKGADVLVGGDGSDTMKGGQGADTFVLDSRYSAPDAILDFKPKQGDKILYIAPDDYSGGTPYQNGNVLTVEDIQFFGDTLSYVETRFIVGDNPVATIEQDVAAIATVSGCFRISDLIVI